MKELQTKLCDRKIDKDVIFLLGKNLVIYSELNKSAPHHRTTGSVTIRRCSLVGRSVSLEDEL